MTDAQLEEVLARATMLRDSLTGFIEAVDALAHPTVPAESIEATGWEVRLGDYWVPVVGRGTVPSDQEDPTPYYIRLEFEEPHGGKVYPRSEPVVAREVGS